MRAIGNADSNSPDAGIPWLAWMSLAAAFLLPLKLSLTYVVLLPSLLIWLWQNWGIVQRKLLALNRFSGPLYIFLICAVITAPFGLRVGNSLLHLSSVAFIALTIPFFADAARQIGPIKILAALMCGQAIAALHSVIYGATSGGIPRLFIGEVSESGQIGLTIVIALGMALALDRTRRRSGLNINELSWGLFNFLIFTGLAFSPSFQITGRSLTLLICVGAASSIASLAFIWRVHKQRANFEETLRTALHLLIIPLIGAALLVNLKRGPWAGVALGALFLIYRLSKRLVIPLAILLVALLFFFQPVRHRIAQSSDHFFISGGRGEIWEIGVELSTRYPLGIGFRNSSFLREFSAEIPPQLTHFHNNLLNILVETGWLGLGIYLWWLISLIRLGLANHTPEFESFLSSALACALLSWQVAGLVEYNFGDSEVLLIAFLVIGLLAELRTRSYAASVENRDVHEFSLTGQSAIS